MNRDRRLVRGTANVVLIYISIIAKNPETTLETLDAE